MKDFVIYNCVVTKFLLTGVPMINVILDIKANGLRIGIWFSGILANVD